MYDIEIFITSQNEELYKKCKKFIPSKWDVRLINGNLKSNSPIHTYKFYGILALLEALRTSNAPIVIMLDEDAFMSNIEQVELLIDYMYNSDYLCCGVRDGGMISHRLHNPLVLNLFFNIFNMKQLKKIPENIQEHQNLNNIDKPIFNFTFHYQYDLFEPYYCFYLWAIRNKMKILYLDCKEYHDGLTTIVQYNKKPIVYHSWFAREYQKKSFHTQRIDDLISHVRSNHLKKSML